jgi:hypothetical protein
METVGVRPASFSELHLSLKHPSIVRVDSFEMDQDGDHLLVFMEVRIVFVFAPRPGL